jgi:SAM-dependent methyltransferase
MKRKPFQGVTNIIRFNWHFYVIAAILTTAAVVIRQYLPEKIRIVLDITILLALLSVVVSLAVSYYIYDLSGLYTLDYLKRLNIAGGKNIININAGFDETSHTIKEKFKPAYFAVYDFYDAAKHTEISIERARKAYPPYQATVTIETDKVPAEKNSLDNIFLIFAAHEIRDNNERIEFFKQLGNALKADGKIIITEHQRDVFNFLAYNIGFFHFLSDKTWKDTFTTAGLVVQNEFKFTPFIRNYILVRG